MNPPSLRARSTHYEPEPYFDVGRLGGSDGRCTCVHCGAAFWALERLSNSSWARPVIGRCCNHGAVSLALPEEPPEPLWSILYTNTPSNKWARQNLRALNHLTSMVSSGITDVCPDGAPGNIVLQGQALHMAGSFHPRGTDLPSFMSIIIVDTEMNGLDSVALLHKLDTKCHGVYVRLRDMLRDVNPYVQLGMRAAIGGVGVDAEGNLYNLEPGTDMALHFSHDVGPNFDRRTLGVPTQGEIGAIVVGDFTPHKRDIVIRRNVPPGENGLTFIHDLNPHYLPMAYPLLFPYGFMGWSPDIKDAKGKKVTPLDFARFLIQASIRERALSSASRASPTHLSPATTPTNACGQMPAHYLC